MQPPSRYERRIKTAETVPRRFRALLAPGQIAIRQVDVWQPLAQPLEPAKLDRAD